MAKPHNGHQAKNEAAKSASVPNAVAVVKRSPRAKPSQSLQPLVVSVPVAQRMLGDIDRKSVTALIDEGILKVRRLSTLPVPGRPHGVVLMHAIHNARVQHQQHGAGE